MKSFLHRLMKRFENREKKNLYNMDRVCRDANGELNEYCIKEYHQIKDNRI